MLGSPTRLCRHFFEQHMKSRLAVFSNGLATYGYINVVELTLFQRGIRVDFSSTSFNDVVTTSCNRRQNDLHSQHFYNVVSTDVRRRFNVVSKSFCRLGFCYCCSTTQSVQKVFTVVFTVSAVFLVKSSLSKCPEQKQSSPVEIFKYNQCCVGNSVKFATTKSVSIIHQPIKDNILNISGGGTC